MRFLLLFGTVNLCLAGATAWAQAPVPATDPVIKNGEMVAEYHVVYASAALMAINDIHTSIAPAEEPAK